jgi:SPP1 family predicted phage head-tail adaptor
MIPQRAFNLDTRIRLERRNPTDDSVGDPVPGWTQYAEVWAHLAPQSGGESVLEGQIHATTLTRITIRYRGDVLATDRIFIGEDTEVPYNIEAILGREFRRDEITLLVTDGNNAG